MTTPIGRNGHLLNHVELFHRPAERELAVQFFELLRLTVVDVTEQFGASTTYLCAFPDATAKDPLNNAVYLSEIQGTQLLEKLLVARSEHDPELRDALEQYGLRTKKLGGAMHFGLRYQDFEDVEALVESLEQRLPAELEGRVTVQQPFAVSLPALGTEVLQGFVHTDVVGAGLFPFGQLIELQAQRALHE
jgi:hypothetical protein